ncbi:MAG: hypothetical protein WAK13_14550, partial [Terriglobales bacterium]
MRTAHAATTAMPNLRGSATVLVADDEVADDEIAEDEAAVVDNAETGPLPEGGPGASATTEVREESSERCRRFRSA